MSDEPTHPIGGEGAIAIGLTKRELLAAMAMQGILANPYYCNPIIKEAWMKSGITVESLAVKFSNGLIAELSKESK